MSRLLISIIIPVYNVKPFLEKCLESVINQAYKDIEIILIDDGSTDGSGMICDRYAEIDNRITIIHKKNAGVSAARNDGIDIANGEYICFVDSDDWLELDYLETIVPILINRKPSLLINNWVRVGTDDSIFNMFDDNKKIISLVKDEALIQLAKQDYYGWGPVASFYEATACKRCKFDESVAYGEDLLFKYCFIKEATGEIIYQPLAKYYYFFRESSAVNSYGLRRKLDDIKVLEHIIEQEDNRVGDVFYKKVYLPQLVYYSVNAFFSDNEDDKLVAKTINRKIVSSFKVRLVITFLTIYIRKLIGHFMSENFKGRLLKMIKPLRQ